MKDVSAFKPSNVSGTVFPTNNLDVCWRTLPAKSHLKIKQSAFTSFLQDDNTPVTRCLYTQSVQTESDFKGADYGTTTTHDR
jgi:hypothetical protein